MQTLQQRSNQIHQASYIDDLNLIRGGEKKCLVGLTTVNIMFNCVVINNVCIFTHDIINNNIFVYIITISIGLLEHWTKKIQRISSCS